MKRVPMKLLFQPLSALVLSAATCAILPAAAQVQAPKLQPRITAPIDNSSRVTLAGSHPPRALAADDIGAVPGTLQLQGISLVFSRSAAQQNALDALVAAQQNPASPLYHHWITPDQYAAQFGVADSDIAAAETWLEQQGFSVDRVSRSRNRIYFSGTAGQVANAFGVPAALLPHRRATPFSLPQGTSLPRPTSAFPPPSAPAFWPSATCPTSGLSRTSSVAEFSRPGPASPPARPGITTSLPATSPPSTTSPRPTTPATPAPTSPSPSSASPRSISQTSPTSRTPSASPARRPSSSSFPAPAPPPSMPTATKPSPTSISSTPAPSPKARRFTSSTPATATKAPSTPSSTPIDQRTAPIISSSYGECEPALGASEYASYNADLEQAAAQGQTVVAAAGDDGSTDCYGGFNAKNVTGNEQLAVDFPGSSQYVTSMGGTEFPVC